MSFDFNFALHVFIPKGDRPEDYQEVIRESDAVRTIACKNTHSRTVCEVVKQSCALRCRKAPRRFRGDSDMGGIS